MLWPDRTGSFGHQLTPRQQWDLRAFFAPAEELDAAAAIAHRAIVVARDPSLPQRAGRAIKQLRADVTITDRHATIAAAYAGGRKCRERGPVTAHAIVRPQIYPEHMSRALVRIMQGIQEHYDRNP